MYVVGVDGCRGGWVAAACNGRSVRFAFYPTLKEVFLEHPDAARIAVDIPLGLAEGGPRRCDVDARGLLGPRRSSVFPAPDRRVAEAFAEGELLHAEANALSRRLTGKGLSAQTYNILPKIVEADALVTPEGRGRVLETHPELLFLALAGRPMRFPKKKPEGFAERRRLLAGRFPGLGVRDRSAARGLCRPAAPDDLLDAAAAAASAWRFAVGEASRLPEGLPEHDRRGIGMEIVF